MLSVLQLQQKKFVNVIYMEAKIKEVYYNPTTGLISANKLYHKLKDQGITLKQVQDFLKKQETSQRYKPITKEKVYFPITSFKPNQHLQIDLMDLSNISTTNSYFKYLLVSIDIFTRKAYVVPLKFKNTESVVEGMKRVINYFKPEIITSDNGKEYTNKELRELLKQHNVEHRFVDVNQHESLGLVDRLCRTIRGLINKFSTSYKTTRYIDVLDRLIENYNDTFHSTIKCSPNDAIKHADKINDIMAKKYIKAKEQETVFKIGDKVRHLTLLNIFEKQGKPKWSDNIFSVEDKKAHSYKLSDGKWYRYYQLQPVEEAQDIKKIGRPAKHTFQTLQKAITVKRRLRKEDVNLKNVAKEPRLRQKTDRFSY